MKVAEMRSRLGALLLAISATLVLAPIHSAAAYDLEVRAGTVLKLSMDSYLTSRTAEVGDPFTATVFEDLRINGNVIIPRGSKIEGRVSAVTAAQRQNKSGTLAIDFNKLHLPDGTTIDIEGQLTSLDAGEKRQIDEEGKVSGGSTAKRNVVFIGGGAAGGAAIGAIAGGGKGAGIGAGIGAVAGVLGSVFSKGEEAQVMVGQKFGMELTRSVYIQDNLQAGDLNPPRDDRRNDRRDDRFDDRRDDRRDDRSDNNAPPPPDNVGPALRRPGADLNSQLMIRHAQTAMRDLNYYTGPINGMVGNSTHSALRAYQRDFNLEQTGELDFNTAVSLGIINDSGLAVVPVRVLDAKVERGSDGVIHVTANTETNTGGWQVYADSVIDNDVLNVRVKGAPPQGIASQVISHYPVDISVPDTGKIKRVVVSGDGAPITLELANPLIDLSRQIKDQTFQLLDTYRESAGIGRRGTNDFDNAGQLTEAQAQALVALTNLHTTASLVEKLVGLRASDAGLRGAVTSLMREARQAHRLLERLNELPRVQNAWGDLDRNLRTMADSYRINPDAND